MGIQLCPDYTTCECPLRCENPDDKPHESEDVCLHTDENVGLLTNNTEEINIPPFPATTSLNKHPHMELKSCMKQKERGDISTYLAGGMTNKIEGSNMESAQNDCFSAAQTSAEELNDKHINIITNMEEAGACLPLLEVNQIDYCTREEAKAETLDSEPTVFIPPPL